MPYKIRSLQQEDETICIYVAINNKKALQPEKISGTEKS
jgi:hypothetical protein